MFENVFSSVDSSLYTVLDELIFIDTDIFKDSYFKKIFGSSPSSGILLIANALLIGFVIYYCIKLFGSNFGISQTQSPYQFIFKAIIFGIFMNFSFFICEQSIYINSLISSSIRALGESIFKTNMCFSSLLEKINSSIYTNSNINIFSIDGIIKSIISIGFLNLLFSYAVRYILVKVFILISPFAFLSLTISSTSIFFRSWIKCFFSLLFIQEFISLVLLLSFSINFSSKLFSKFLFVGVILVLIKSNTLVREFLGGINTEIGGSIKNLKNIF